MRFFVLDGEKRILYVNKACERHYGLKPTDVIGKYNVDLFEKRVLDALHRA
ncbi:PAS domain-containing protein [Peribacillus frigoritolerans]|nr:PAS domain-containing protein [Peribacillus frigoritolerans]